MNLPGQEQAEKMGYALHSFSGDHATAHYIKDGIGLDVWGTQKEAEISFLYGLLLVTTGKFGWPHPNFAQFERQVQQARAKLQATEETPDESGM